MLFPALSIIAVISSLQSFEGRSGFAAAELVTAIGAGVGDGRDVAKVICNLTCFLMCVTDDLDGF